MTISIVLADANILLSRTLRDYFLYAADAGGIEIHWSQQILDEMSRNLRAKFGFTQADTDRLENLMNNYIEYALIEVDPDDLASVQVVEIDPKDRHVLAAAMSVDADILLTENTPHFPQKWMSERSIDLLDAATLLTRLAVRFPDRIRAAHDQTVRLSRKPEMEILDVLGQIIGDRAIEVIRDLVQSAEDEPGPDVEGPEGGM